MEVLFSFEDISAETMIGFIIAKIPEFPARTKNKYVKNYQ